MDTMCFLHHQNFREREREKYTEKKNRERNRDIDIETSWGRAEPSSGKLKQARHLL